MQRVYVIICFFNWKVFYCFQVLTNRREKFVTKVALRSQVTWYKMNAKTYYAVLLFLMASTMNLRLNEILEKNNEMKNKSIILESNVCFVLAGNHRPVSLEDGRSF